MPTPSMSLVPVLAKSANMRHPFLVAIHGTAQGQGGLGPDPTLMFNACMGYLVSFLEYLRHDHGDEVVAQLRRKIFLRWKFGNRN